MNTRQPIQSSADPLVLSVSFSTTQRRFIASLSDGLRVFRTDNCLTTYRPPPAKSSSPNSLEGISVAVAAVLDDRYLAYVPRTISETSDGSGNVVVFYDCELEREVCRFNLHEPIRGLSLNSRWMCVILRERTVVFVYQELRKPQQPTPPPDLSDSAATETESDEHRNYDVLRGPNKVHNIYPTAPNPFSLASFHEDLLVLPAQSTGQVQLIPLRGGSKRVLKAHNTAIRQLVLSPDSSLLATASEQGTLIRVFDVRTLDQIAEFRRGLDKAIIFSLAFSRGNRWLACTSDKGNLHIFDLRPGKSTQMATEKEASLRHRKNPSHPIHRLSGGAAMDKESLSAFSGRSSSPSTAIPAGTTYQGSVQEYYGLRPPPASASLTGRETAVSAMAAFKASPWTPKVLKDVRSVASAPFWMGDDGPYWQGGGSHKWTVTPSGVRKRVHHPVPPLPNDPTGRPPKGVVSFVPVESTGAGNDGRKVEAGIDDDAGAALYVLGGGREGRWEMFDLVPVPSQAGVPETGWVVVQRGFRRFLNRQFVN